MSKMTYLTLLSYVMFVSSSQVFSMFDMPMYYDYGSCDGMFQCGDGECISEFSRCNGLPECHDGSDETNCLECELDEYMCANSERCLSRTLLCDGQTDCPDGEDEDRKVCTRYCEPTDHKCTNGQCIPLQLFCNGTMCKDGSDDPENSLVIDVQPGLTINCSFNLLNNMCPDNVKRLTLSRFKKTSQTFKDILTLQVGSKKKMELKQNEQIEDKDFSFGHFFVSLNVQDSKNGDEYKCEASISNRYKIITTQTQTYTVRMNTSKAEDVTAFKTDLPEILTVKEAEEQHPTAKQQSKEFILSVLPHEVDDGFTDDLEILCRYKNASVINIFSISILHSTSVEKSDFKYLCSVNSFNQKIQNHFPSLKSVNGTIDPIEGSHVSLIFDDSKVKKTGLYKCEVIGFDLEQGKPVIDSKEFLVEASDTKIETVIGKIHNETSLIRQSLDFLQSISKSNTLTIQETERGINQLKLDVNESMSGLVAGNERAKNLHHNLTKLSNEFHNNLLSLKKSVSDLRNKWNAVKNKFNSVETLIHENHNELVRVKNKVISENSVQKHLQKIESSITQQKSFTQLAVGKFDAVKKQLENHKVKYIVRKVMTDPEINLLETAKSLFITSNLFRGRRYLVTRKNYNVLVPDAQALCITYGGYLVEIDTQDEFTFVREFIYKNVKFDYVYLSGTDSIQEGVWINRLSLSKMSVINWSTGQPIYYLQNKHCQCFWRVRFQYVMNDCNCSSIKDGGFVCEIPILR